MRQPQPSTGDNNDDHPESTGSAEASDAIEGEAADPATASRRINWSRVLVFGLLPGLALVLAITAGLLKWQESSTRDAGIARLESVRIAKDSIIGLLTYRPETVEEDLAAAEDGLTGRFRDTYSQLSHDVLIPDAKHKNISAIASVPAAASVSATPNHAVVLLFVDQLLAVGASEPVDTASSFRVSLDKMDGRWLISNLEPI